MEGEVVHLGMRRTQNIRKDQQGILCEEDRETTAWRRESEQVPGWSRPLWNADISRQGKWA